MELKAISTISGTALLALTATVSAGPMSVTSSQIMMPPTSIEQAHYYHRHHYRHYGWHHPYRHYGWHRGWHYGWHRGRYPHSYYSYGYGYPYGYAYPYGYRIWGWACGSRDSASGVSRRRDRAPHDWPKRGGGRKLLRDSHEDVLASGAWMAWNRLLLQGRRRAGPGDC